MADAALGGGVIAGIEGSRARWQCVWARLAEPTAVPARLLDRLNALEGLQPCPGVIAVDIPIGLPETERRACELADPALLGRPRASSVFPAALRPMLPAASYEAACTIGRAAAARALPPRELEYRADDPRHGHID